MTKKLTTEEFIRRAREVHGDKYDYTNTFYESSRKDVYIRCNRCGSTFKQIASVHLRGSGCRNCEKHYTQNKLRKKIYNSGILDVDFSCNKDEITAKAYKIWGAMFRRCNSPIGSKHNPAYHDCFVCDGWHYFSNFLSWFKDNYIKGYALDKDILVKGNKMYSPETCCFVPIEINSLLTNRRNHRGNALGTFKTKNGTFQAHCSMRGKMVHLGTFKTEKEAFATYKQSKESYIKEVAQDYFERGLITQKVYNALLNYKVEITD